MLCNPLAPETYPRRILLAVSGLAPQVVTENLYFLCCTRKPSFVPTELRIVSTDRGREIAELSLLHEDQGKFWDFVKDYGLEGKIAFDSNMIHVLRNSKGEALEDNNPVSTANAGILLSEIPLVMLRHGLPENLISGEATYMATVAAAKRSFAPANLVVDYSKRRLICGDQEVVLPPQHFAWYAWMARRRLQADDYGGHVGWRDKDIADEFLQEYKNVIGHMAHGYEEAANNLAEGMSKEFFDEKKSRVNRMLRETLGLGAAPYLIQSSGKRPSQRFGLSIPITSIFVTSRSTVD